MRALMLGWEFPPHISGGLGTACFGLTQGLAHHGVDVTFVVPRAFGDEDQRYVRLLGANTVPIRRVRSRPAAARRRGEAEPVIERELANLDPTIEAPVEIELEARERTRLVEELRVLEVESLLRPYLDEPSYLQHVRELTGLSETEWTERTRAAPTDARDAVAELERALGASEPDVAKDALAEAVEREETFDFTGFYGPNLLSEVARYALVVGSLAKRERFDVVHAHDWMTYPAGILAAKVSGKPLVLHMHACEYDRSGDHVNERIRGIEQLGFYHADRVICVSHYTANTVRSRYFVEQDKLRVVHNAVTHRQQIEGWHWEKHIDDPIVLFLGRVTFQKGPDYFLEAAARVVRIEPKVKFVMSGHGDMLPRMIERAARLGLARHVHFTGFLRGDEVERMYAMADIYVMPSVSEPFGISPLEAMALDVPVIVSRQSGVSEILRNALKVDFWNVQDMANKILALLRYPALSTQLTEEGREELAGLRWDVRGKLVREVYEELVA